MMNNTQALAKALNATNPIDAFTNVSTTMYDFINNAWHGLFLPVFVFGLFLIFYTSKRDVTILLPPMILFSIFIVVNIADPTVQLVTILLVGILIAGTIFKRFFT